MISLMVDMANMLSCVLVYALVYGEWSPTDVKVGDAYWCGGKKREKINVTFTGFDPDTRQEERRLWALLEWIIVQALQAVALFRYKTDKLILFMEFSNQSLTFDVKWGYFNKN